VLSALGLFFVVFGVLQSGAYGWGTATKDYAIGGTVIIQQGGISPVWLYVGIGVVILALFIGSAYAIAASGLVITYAHTPTPGMPARVGVLLQLSCETDFVAKNEQFQKLAKDLAMHIAAVKPLVVSEDKVDAELLEKEKEFARKEAVEQGKPENIIDKIVEGKVRKVYEDWVLLNQAFVLDSDKTVAQVISEVQGILGEKVEVARFARFEVGA
jgi:elongation factor Ts